MESKVALMAIGVISLLSLLLVLTTLLLAAIFGGKTARTVLLCIGGGLFLLIAIGAMGMLSVRTEAYVPQAVEVPLEARQIHSPPPYALTPRARMTAVSAAAPQRAREKFFPDAGDQSLGSADAVDEPNPGRALGEWAGSLYQGFRNQVKSGQLSLDASSIIPPGRPTWVEQEPIGEPGEVYTVAVSSGPYDRETDCRAALDEQVREAVGQFASEFLGHPDAARLLATELVSLQADAVRETYQEELTPSIGIMHQWHALLKFDETFQQKLLHLWETQQRLSRVIYVGGGFGGLLALLTIFYFCLSLSGEGSRVSPWLVSAGTVAALGGLFLAAIIFVRTFPML